VLTTDVNGARNVHIDVPASVMTALAKDARSELIAPVRS
jgi:hypothetical protein